MRLQHRIERLLWNPLDAALTRLMSRWWLAIPLVIILFWGPLWILMWALSVSFALFLVAASTLFLLYISWGMYVIPLRLRQMNAVVQKQLKENLRKYEQPQQAPK